MDHGQMQQSDFYVTGAIDPESAKQTGSIEDLDRGLDLLEKSLSMLEQRIGPALSQYGHEAVASPRAELEPSSQLRGRAVRLLHLVAQVDSLTSRIDL